MNSSDPPKIFVKGGIILLKEDSRSFPWKKIALISNNIGYKLQDLEMIANWLQIQLQQDGEVYKYRNNRCCCCCRDKYCSNRQLQHINFSFIWTLLIVSDFLALRAISRKRRYSTSEQWTCDTACFERPFGEMDSSTTTI